MSPSNIGILSASQISYSLLFESRDKRNSLKVSVTQHIFFQEWVFSIEGIQETHFYKIWELWSMFFMTLIHIPGRRFINTLNISI